MKTICAALGMAALLTFSVSADTLTLPHGQVLDFGETVDILDGSETYFGKAMKDWTNQKDFDKTMETMVSDIKGKTDENAKKDAARFAAKAWEDTRVYQLRANTPEAFYETFVLSLPVENKEGEQAKKVLRTLAEDKAPENAAKKKTVVSDRKWKEAPIEEPYRQLLEKRKIRIYVSDMEHWKEKKSSGGKSYRLGKAKISVDYDGYVLPLFVEGLIMDDGVSTTYTLFAGDQKSGAYFAPYVEKAAREMK